MIYPYGTTYCEWDKIIPFAPLWEQYNRIVKENGAVVLFAAQPFTTKLINSNLKNFRYCWYWKKNYTTGFAYARYQPMRCIEDICVFYKNAGAYRPQGLKLVESPQKFKKYKGSIYRVNTGQRYSKKYTNWPRHLLEFKNEAKSNKARYHPTQKPVALLEYLIKTYTAEGGLVLDNCMGSGSTGVACVNTGRRFIGIELNKEYFEVAARRIAEAQNKQHEA